MGVTPSAKTKSRVTQSAFFGAQPHLSEGKTKSVAGFHNRACLADVRLSQIHHQTHTHTHTHNPILNRAKITGLA